MWVDSDHAGDKMTRRLCTGYFIFLNTALIDWLSKKQATIEGSVFGSEFIAMKGPKPFASMYLTQEESLLNYVCGLIVTTQETKLQGDHAQGISCS